jgi:hypothetical protein
VSGIVCLSPDHKWVQAGWAYDALRRGLLEVLPAEASSIREEVLEDIKTGMGLLDFTDLSKEDFALLASAISAILANLQSAGPASFADPSAFAGFVRAVRDLDAAAASDPRATA